MSGNFARRVSATVKDMHGDLIKGATVSWFINGNEAGSAVSSDGYSSIETTDPKAIVSVKAEYGGQSKGPILLAQNQDAWNFVFAVDIHPEWREFPMKHFPAIVGIVFILIAVVLVFVFPGPSPLQTHVILAMFSLGGGGFGGEIAGLHQD